MKAYQPPASQAHHLPCGQPAKTTAGGTNRSSEPSTAVEAAVDIVYTLVACAWLLCKICLDAMAKALPAPAAAVIASFLCFSRPAASSDDEEAPKSKSKSNETDAPAAVAPSNAELTPEPTPEPTPDPELVPALAPEPELAPTETSSFEEAPSSEPLSEPDLVRVLYNDLFTPEHFEDLIQALGLFFELNEASMARELLFELILSVESLKPLATVLSDDVLSDEAFKLLNALVTEKSSALLVPIETLKEQDQPPIANSILKLPKFSGARSVTFAPLQEALNWLVHPDSLTEEQRESFLRNDLNPAWFDRYSKAERSRGQRLRWENEKLFNDQPGAVKYPRPKKELNEQEKIELAAFRASDWATIVAHDVAEEESAEESEAKAGTESETSVSLPAMDSLAIDRKKAFKRGIDAEANRLGRHEDAQDRQKASRAALVKKKRKMHECLETADAVMEDVAAAPTKDDRAATAIQRVLRGCSVRSIDALANALAASVVRQPEELEFEAADNAAWDDEDAQVEQAPAQEAPAPAEEAPAATPLAADDPRAVDDHVAPGEPSAQDDEPVTTTKSRRGRVRQELDSTLDGSYWGTSGTSRRSRCTISLRL